MTLPPRKAAWHSAPLKIISIILGYTFWYTFSSSHITTVWVQVPVSFYNIPLHHVVRSPEHISLKISGKRSEIRMLDIENVAIHINAQELKTGKNKLDIHEESLFLPSSIKLLDYSPSNPVITLVAQN